MSNTARPALLLNADFRPLSIYPLSLIGWQDAVRSVLMGKLVTVEEYDTVIRSAGSATRARFEMRLPSVVALRNYQSQDRPAAFTRIGIYVRDRFRCAYCGERFPAHQLTFDHVVPRSGGGKTRWTNIVAADARCNLIKANKTLEMSGMKLLHTPYAPRRHQLNEIAKELRFSTDRLHTSWLAYLGIPASRDDDRHVVDGQLTSSPP